MTFPQISYYSLIYLDGFDYLRRLSADCERALAVNKVPSEAFLRFQATCKTKGVPLSEAKTLVAAVRAGCLGGSFDGEKGILSLSAKTAQNLFCKGLVLSALPQWSEAQLRH